MQRPQGKRQGKAEVLQEGFQEKIQGSQSPREASLSSEGKVPQVQESEQGVLQEKDPCNSIGL